jgi:hypothetical protein
MVSFMPIEVKIGQYVVIVRLIETSNGFFTFARISSSILTIIMAVEVKKKTSRNKFGVIQS